MTKDYQTAGLSSIEAEKRLEQFGPNIIFKSAKISFLGIAKHEVTEPMILLLLVVGFVYSIWGKLEDALTIFTVIFLLVFAEVYNEFRAKTKVLRDGATVEIDSENVVPGDILILTPGTKIAADAKVRQGIDLQSDESSLTGESFPQNKSDGSEIYAGTVVASGEGQAEVITTGKDTKLGKTADTLTQIKPPRTALQLAMRSLAGKLVYVAYSFQSSFRF
jgi:Ca2+-transporting ATPase